MSWRWRLASVAAVALAASGCTGGAPHTPAPTSGRTAPGVASSPHPVTTPASRRPATTSTAPSGTPAGPRTVTVLGSGDVLIHPPLWAQAHADALAEGRTGYDFGPMYAGVAGDVARADLAICEMESPLAPPQGPFRGWPEFDSPPQVLPALTHIGYDSCTTASNHSIDQGLSGVKRTLDELDAAGLKHTGSARSASEAATPLIMTMPNGVRVAQLAYAFGFNGLSRPPGQSWLANLTDIPTILAAAHRAKKAGADIVVLSMHWGTEYDRLATPEQREQAQRLLASPDIDVILGDHAHVVQPMQKIDGKWVIYCMGNQISRHADPILAGREGAMAQFTFTEVSPGRFRITRAKAIPTLMLLAPKLRLIDLTAAVASQRTSARDRAAYERSVEHITKALDAYGADRYGLVIG